MLALFVNIDIGRSSFIVLSRHILVWLVLPTALSLSSVWPKKSPTVLPAPSSLHTLISCTPSSILSTDTPRLHFKGPSQSLYNFKKVSHPAFQTGEGVLKHLQNDSLSLLWSPLCHVASRQLDTVLGSWQALRAFASEIPLVLSFYAHLRVNSHQTPPAH